MNATRLDTISKLFATRRSRRQALAQAGAGLAAAVGAAGLAHRTATAAQDEAATPSAAASAENEGPVFLFLQAFQAGSVAAKEGSEGRYTLTLEQGLGHTVYFSDRPDRIVGATPTPQFLQGLGFPDDNPPNAALVVETAEGQTELAVVELFDPSYDEATRTATYEVAVLAEWERAGEAGFTETAADLSAFGATFGAAHLFIDDCPNGGVTCYAGDPSTEIVSRGSLSGIGFCWHWDLACCKPCDPNWYNTWALECDRVYGCDQKYALGPGYCWASMETPAFGCAE